jgi:hypothetical protein
MENGNDSDKKSGWPERKMPLRQRQEVQEMLSSKNRFFISLNIPVVVCTVNFKVTDV